ncbi:MAG: 2-iminoacetate synthase ThiH [Candidatus Cloacimonetes bacterium]|nr:2-iminoacetate synthase ThiH [Candidatus Cloacimonadota bacterium]
MNNILNIIFQFIKNYSYEKYSENDISISLQKESLNIHDFGVLLSPAAESFLEKMAHRAKNETRKHFGNAISLYTPLYLSNYCENNCIYCGFNTENKIKRGKLSLPEIDNELKAIANTGLKEILLLTGEDRSNTNADYIGKAIKLASKYFTTIGLEIYPLNVDEYAYLYSCGADFVSIYQETYDIDLYQKLHVCGPKKDFIYRFESQERALNAGMRGVSLGFLLGLGDFRKDAFATGLHAYFLQQKFTDADIAFSVPRLRINSFSDPNFNSQISSEKNLLQTMLAYRLFMPFSSIAISTRERAAFRDNVIGIAATKISAEVKTSVGGHIEKKGDEQFRISDSRNVSQIHNAIISKRLQPIYADFISMRIT